MEKPWTTEDGELPEVTPEMFTQMRPLRDYPEKLAMFKAASAALKASRGRPRGTTKRTVTISLDGELIDTLRASGKGWQTRVNTTLREAFLGHH